MGKSEWPTCTTCGNQYNPDDIRTTHPYRHPVNGPLKSPKSESTEQSDKTRVDQLPTDPILRMVLVKKGIISPLDLTEAEDLLAASGIAGAKAGRMINETFQKAGDFQRGLNNIRDLVEGDINPDDLESLREQATEGFDPSELALHWDELRREQIRAKSKFDAPDCPICHEPVTDMLQGYTVNGLDGHAKCWVDAGWLEVETVTDGLGNPVNEVYRPIEVEQ